MIEVSRRRDDGPRSARRQPCRWQDGSQVSCRARSCASAVAGSSRAITNVAGNELVVAVAVVVALADEQDIHRGACVKLFVLFMYCLARRFNSQVQFTQTFEAHTKSHQREQRKSADSAG